jgi:type II secretory ATPase GspE/PulE/Tfp pilus assembly ATPase PilB-like protein
MDVTSSFTDPRISDPPEGRYTGVGMPASLDDRLREALARPEEESPMGRGVRVLLEDAAASGVSDVHLNPGAEGLDVFYRHDGVLQPRARIAPDRAERFLGKVKVLAGLLTYRKDIPQDGQIPAAEAGGKTDVRVSFFPTVLGEKAVLRFFLHGPEKFELDLLGFSQETVERLRAAAAKPDGVLLLTGPSGSGKTTTIYALLAEIVRPGVVLRHVVTIEDPVEHGVPGITQTQVNPPAGLTFAASLRSLLRQDPQVIMVGEIRDRETARVAMEAGLTGHLVISTLHTGTAAGVVTRLFEMGIEPHVLTASLSLVLAQRLARRRCPSCEKGPVPSGRLEARAEGCDACQGTGFRGRQVFGEMLVVDEVLRKALADAPSRERLEELAVSRGMTPLRAEAERLVREGTTTEEEVRRVLG